MKYILVLVLVVCLFTSYCCASQNESILSAVEALEQVKQELLSQLEQPQSDASYPFKRCVNTNNLIVRSDSGSTTSERLNQETEVTLWASKQLNGLEYVKIGNNRWVAAKFLKMSCAPKPVGGNKEEEALKEILGSEGQCQNWSGDSGNKFEGRIGYTCVGIIPSVGWNSRNSAFGYAVASFRGHPSMFVKHAYDVDRSKFTEGSKKIYREQYFGPGGCSPLPQPIFYVCSDIAVNSGTGRSKQFLRELGAFSGSGSTQIKDYARRLNEKHRAFYKYIGRPGTKNNRFLRGWLNRADHRDTYINNYRV